MNGVLRGSPEVKYQRSTSVANSLARRWAKPIQPEMQESQVKFGPQTLAVGRALMAEN